MKRLIPAVVMAALVPAALAPVAAADQITGNPLTITATGTGSLQIADADRGGATSFFESVAGVGNAGLEIVEGTSYFPLTAGRTPRNGPTLTTVGAEQHLTSVYDVGPDLQVTETLSYVEGSRAVDVTYDIKNISAAATSFRAAELADVTAGGDDRGRGFLLDHGASTVGGWTPEGGLIALAEQTTWEHHESGRYGDVFGHFADGGLTDRVDPTLVDNGVGAEWGAQALAANATATFQVRWIVGPDEAVNSVADDGDGACTTAPGGCTLREALTTGSGGDIVTVPADDRAYQLNGAITLSHDVTVLGGAARDVTIHGPTDHGDQVIVVGAEVTADLRSLTITGGDAGDGDGGGIRALAGSTLRVSDSSITGNRAWDGGGINAAGQLELARSTVSGNHADQNGGGIYLRGASVIENSTISGNAADNATVTNAGGGLYVGDDLTLTNVTIADNVADPDGGGGLVEQVDTQETHAVNTLLVRNTGGSCRGNQAFFSAYGLSDDATCFSRGGAGNIFNTVQHVGPLADNGGDTLTQLPGPGSDAIDRGNPLACPPIDQRGLPRPTGTGCDIGAVEANQTPGFVTVFTHVVNDNGGHATAEAFLTHIRRGGVDATPPDVGDELGEFFEVPGGVYQVVAGPVPGYTVSYGGDCAGGTITVPEGTERECRITANDVGQTQATLKVVTQVVNDDGGTLAPGDFTVRVRRGGSDVAGSPKAGSATGTTYTLPAGTYTVAAAAPADYTAAIGGACAASGSVTLAAGASKTCTVTGNDKPPTVHKTVNIEPSDGTVKVKVPGSDQFVTLQEGQQVPLGSVLDTVKGRVTLHASDGKGGTATADFYEGVFKVGQTKGKDPITVLTLVEKLSCPKGKATTAKKKKRKRRLWGDGHGRFQTRGKHSAATVVGTKWLVEDTCTTTLTRVARGKVKVRDFMKKKTVTVKAGHKYIARARTP